MSAGLMEKVKSEGGELVRPSQTLETAESSRVTAEIQAALTVAQARPRDEQEAIRRIKNACQRQRLAEGSTYQYSKGGSDIAGPSVRLLECVAQNWGNITFGFRELSQSVGESSVEAFAWDMETNTKRSLVFVVPHRMKSGKGFRQLTDPREIYEHVANQAQRRVRSCLENVIPRDVVEDAVDECTKTLRAKADVSPEAMKKMVEKFGGLGVSKQQIEQRLGRNLDAIQPAQVLSLRRIFNSIKDGMSEPKDWFKPVEEAAPETDKKPAAKSTKEKLKAKSESNPEPETKEPEATEEVEDEGPSDAVLRWERSIKTEDEKEKLIEYAAAIDDDEALSKSEKASLANMINERMK